MVRHTDDDEEEKKGNDDDDSEDDGDGDNGCEVGIYAWRSLKNMLLLLEGDTSIKYQKSRIGVAQANEYGYFWNEGAKL